MLQQLHIQNYAIIEEISIDFSSQLNVITGETGAGKSIIMGALSLIFGDRADTSVLLNREKKCFVEGIFKLEDRKDARLFLKENDLDTEDEITIRREITSAGKSRAFVNDTPVNLEQLRGLSALLVDLHRQFDTLELGESGFQREVLDALGSQGAALRHYQAVFQPITSLEKELKILSDQKLQFDREADYHRFLFEELDQAAFRDRELEQLDEELKLLSNAESIKEVLSKLYFDLQESEQPTLQQLKISANQLHSVASFQGSLPELVRRLQSVQVELQDIADEVYHLNNHIGYDAKRIEEINDRIATGYRLQKKHGVKTTAELLAIRDGLAKKIDAVLNTEEQINQKEKAIHDLREKATQSADLISKARHAQIKKLEQQVNQLLQQVGMPNARLKVQIVKIELNEYGMDSVEFLFDANQTGRFEPLRKVASGGELSRLMLCIKSLVAESIDLPTPDF